ncbi:hypothetical protein SAY87_015646 [Trapa incisa]|uniref:RRM domain-containing protein n=1 Tax=Trapa incisa TaxID=236973 RepID=A0AAN7QXD1_9MYRT|nr:hypothetical protein SAY87_015646 [Trapa incisa]
MPRTKATASSAAKFVEPVKPADSDEKVDLDEDNNTESMEEEEEVEYEDVEEEEEEEEEEEVEEIEEEVEVEEEVEEEEEEEEEDSNCDSPHGSGGRKILKGHDVIVENDEEKEKHEELLARPPHGSEVYIGAIPRDTTEQELRNFCASVGEVTEVRILKGKDSSENKGFAFVTFRNVELASKAIDELNGSEFKGRKIRCSTSQAKYRLFIGNVPKNWNDEDLKKAVMQVGPGVTAVELVKDLKNTSSNRGFAFIDYYNNACAEYSRQKMINPKFKLDNNSPTVSWADPKNADSSASSQVKAVYVKHLPKDITQDRLKKLFEHHGKITRIVLPLAKVGQERNRIGFVHFAERSSAMKALDHTEKYELDGQVLECSLAKPQTEQKPVAGPASQEAGLLPTYPLRVGYGMPSGVYGSLATGFAPASFAQPMIYGRGTTPAGMAMMPMLLPDGRIGYVLQQPGAQPPIMPPPQMRGGNRGRDSVGKSIGSSSSRVRHNSDSNQGRRYRPY